MYSVSVLKFILITYLSIFLTGRILITIYNIFKYLSCIKIAYDNNNDNDNNNNNRIQYFQLESFRLVDTPLFLCICTFVCLDIVDFDDC